MEGAGGKLLLLLFQVAYAWAISLGGDEGALLLKKLGLLEQAIDYAVESGAFAQVGGHALRHRKPVRPSTGVAQAGGHVLHITILLY